MSINETVEFDAIDEQRELIESPPSPPALIDSEDENEDSDSKQSELEWSEFEFAGFRQQKNIEAQYKYFEKAGAPEIAALIAPIADVRSESLPQSPTELSSKSLSGKKRTRSEVDW